MVSRLRQSSPTAVAIGVVALGGALIVGVLSVVQPLYGIAFALGLAFLFMMFSDLAVGMCVMVVLAFLETLSTLGSLSLAKLVGAVLAASWLAVVTSRRTGVRNLFADRPGLSYLLLVFLGWTAVTVWWAPVRGDATSSVMRYALNALLIPIAYTAIRDRRDAVRLLAVVVGGATVAAMTGIISAPAGGADATRATGTVGDANELAAALVVGACVAAAFAVNRRFAPPWRLLALGSAGLCMLGILLSLSRGGLLGLGGALLVAIVVGGRWRGRVAVGAAAAAILAVGYFAFIASLPAKERVTNVGGGTGRVDLWTVGWRMVEAHPLGGIGTGQFQTASVHYLLRPGAIQRGDFILSTPKVAHNTYLNIVAELGVIGGALFAALLVSSLACLWLAAQELRRQGDEQLELLVRGLMAGVGGYLVTLMFISENYSKLLWVLLALGPALLAAARAGRVQPADAPPPRLAVLDPDHGPAPPVFPVPAA